MAKNNLPQFKAQQSCTVTLAAPHVPLAAGVLVDWYLPCLGSTAFGLYHWLWHEGDLGGFGAPEPHYAVLDALNVNLSDFVAARQKIEALGLLKTTLSDDCLHYRVVPPVAPADFVTEPLLAGLLNQLVGETRYSQLCERYHVTAEPIGTRVSASFLQVFRASEAPTVPVQPSAVAATPPAVPAEELAFDFDAFMALVVGTTRSELTQARAFLLAQHALYGINEAELAQIVTQTVTIDNHTIDQMAVTRELARWQAKHRPLEPGVSVVETAPSEPEQVTTLSAERQQLVRAAETLAPLAFLEQLKTAKGGYVGNKERRLVVELYDRKQLPSAVINILVHHIVVGMDQTTIPRDLFDAIANAWSQQQITTAVAAIQAIATHQKSKKTPKKSANYARKGTYQREEPKMATAPAPSQHNDDELQAALAKLGQVKTHQSVD